MQNFTKTFFCLIGHTHKLAINSGPEKSYMIEVNVSVNSALPSFSSSKYVLCKIKHGTSNMCQFLICACTCATVCCVGQIWRLINQMLAFCIIEGCLFSLSTHFNFYNYSCIVAVLSELWLHMTCASHHSVTGMQKKHCRRFHYNTCAPNGHRVLQCQFLFYSCAGHETEMIINNFSMVDKSHATAIVITICFVWQRCRKKAAVDSLVTGPLKDLRWVNRRAIDG